MRFTQWHWYVYIIECLDGSYYTGRTWDIDARFAHHTSGLGGRYTRMHGVKRLAYYEVHDSFESASIREKQIKGWSRMKKERLIDGTWKQEW